MTDESSQPAPAAPSSTPRRRRARRVGVVSSDQRNQTIAVTVSFNVQQPKYGKYLRRKTVLHAHDAGNSAKVGDTVEIQECRPISKSKHWRLLRVLRSPAGGQETA